MSSITTGFGTALGSHGISLVAFFAALVTSGVVFTIQFSVFLLLKDRFARVFLPKAFSPQGQVTRLSEGPWRWIPEIFRQKDQQIIRTCGLDAYFFQRYLQTLLIIFVPLSIVIVPVLVTANFVGGEGDRNPVGSHNTSSSAIRMVRLEQLAWGNLDSSRTHWYWLHLVLALLVVAWVCAVFFAELKAYVHIRYDYFSSGDTRSKRMSTTVLVKEIPPDLLNVEALRRLYSIFPRGVRNIWLNRDLDELQQKIRWRDVVLEKLEIAEADLMKNSMNCFKTKALRQQKSNREKTRSTHWVPRWSPCWPPAFPFKIQRVDTIDWCRSQLSKMDSEIESSQHEIQRYQVLNSAFIQFHHQIAAQMAYHTADHTIPGTMTSKTIVLSRNDVIWDNIALNRWKARVRKLLAPTIVTSMVTFWTFPVAWTASLSQIPSLVSKYEWLHWLAKLPPNVLQAIAGVLPPLFLGALLVLVPIILNYLAFFQGVCTHAEKQLVVQNYYFLFLFVQVFLVVSISGSAIAALGATTAVRTIPETLATQLPKAANYFFSYMIVQALSSSSGMLLRPVALVMTYLHSKIFDRSPRQVWKRTTTLPTLSLGSEFPVYTNFACIVLVYSIVAPLIIVLATVTFTLLWAANRYNMLYVSQVSGDTGGLLYPRAINQSFTGLYVMELCLIGLFLLVRGEFGHQRCIPQSVIMSICFILTIVYHVFVNRFYGPLICELPISLERSGDCNLDLESSLLEEGENQNTHTSTSKRIRVVSQSFQHPALTTRRVFAWAPEK